MAKGGFNTPLLLLILFLAGSIALVVTRGPSEESWKTFEPVAPLPGERFKMELPWYPPAKDVVGRQNDFGKFQETSYTLDHMDEIFKVIVMPYAAEAMAAKNKNPTAALEKFQVFFCKNMNPPWTASGQTPFTTAKGLPGLEYKFSFTTPRGKKLEGIAQLILTPDCQFHAIAMSSVDPESVNLPRFLASFEALPDKVFNMIPSGDGEDAPASPPEDPAPEEPEAPEAPDGE